MTDKKVVIKNLAGDNVYPKTLGQLVINAAGDNLKDVEAGAQVNKLEKLKIKVGDAAAQEIAITNKEATIQVAAATTYEIAKLDAATAGSAATYQLKVNGTLTGTKIEIPKDMFIQSGSLEVVETADTPYAGAEVGDKYIDIILANASDSHVYIPVNSLVDIYTPGDAYVSISNFQVSLNITSLKTVLQEKLSSGQLDAVNSGITATKVGNYDTHLANSDIHVTAAQKTAWTNKQDAITSTNKLDADLVDDTTATNKFVTAAEKALIAGAVQQTNVKSAYIANDTNPVNSVALANFLTYQEISE